MTRYHLDSRQRTSHTATFPASRKFRQWLGISSSPQRPSAFAGPHWELKIKDDSKRCHGRTRNRLPIDGSAPRPCSAAFTVPTHTFLGSLTGYLSLLFSSLPLKILALLYPPLRTFVNRKKKNFGILLGGRFTNRPPKPSPGGKVPPVRKLGAEEECGRKSADMLLFPDFCPCTK